MNAQGHSEMNDQYLDVLRLNYFGKSLDFFCMMWYYNGVPKEQKGSI